MQLEPQSVDYLRIPVDLITRSSVEELDQYAARILKAETLDDVFKKR